MSWFLRKGYSYEKGVQALYIEPGSPWENGYIESFNGKFRDDVLNRELFHSVKEAKVIVENWRLEYNNHRPHSGLGYMTPLALNVLGKIWINLIEVGT